MSKENENTDKYPNGECFVIMPISDPNGYEKGHFKRVYDDIFSHAIKECGYKPKRADDSKASQMIQVDIVKDIVNAPMAICDLSSRNPNVLFELGIRQAFDLPVVLVQEVGTDRIFDISTINTIDYRKERLFHEVLEDQKKIIDSIKETKNNDKGINSIIRLLELEAASIPAGKISEESSIEVMLYTVMNELQNIKKSLEVPMYRVNELNMNTINTGQIPAVSRSRSKLQHRISEFIEYIQKINREIGDNQIRINAERTIFRAKDLLIQASEVTTVKECNILMNELENLKKTFDQEIIMSGSSDTIKTKHNT